MFRFQLPFIFIEYCVYSYILAIQSIKYNTTTKGTVRQLQRNMLDHTAKGQTQDYYGY